jgi:phosphatidylinositol kinase/protein kinase (PI-3  family)
MAKKPKEQKAYDQNTELSTTADETTPLQSPSQQQQPAAEATVESTKEALQAALLKVEFDKIEPAYKKICKELEKGVLPLAQDAVPILNWYKEHIYRIFDVEYKLASLKGCQYGHQWRAFFAKEKGDAIMQLVCKKFKLGDYGAEE